MRNFLLEGASLRALTGAASTSPMLPTIVNYTGHSETYSVASSGTYEIDIAGAQGGGAFGAHGASFDGKLFLTSGETLTIFVGGNGGTGSGGGGGSFVPNDFTSRIGGNAGFVSFTETTAEPEPTSMALFGAGLAGLGLVGRRFVQKNG